MGTQYLNTIMKDNYDINPDDIINYTFKTDSLSFEQLRTRLFMIGTIQFEDQEKKVFLANIKGGFFNLNNALVGIQLNGSLLYISLYSQEGVISQHTNEGVINEIKKQLKAFIKDG